MVCHSGILLNAFDFPPVEWCVYFMLKDVEGHKVCKLRTIRLHLFSSFSVLKMASSSKGTSIRQFWEWNVKELTEYLRERGVSTTGYNNEKLVKLATAVAAVDLPSGPDFAPVRHGPHAGWEATMSGLLICRSRTALWIHKTILTAYPNWDYTIYSITWSWIEQTMTGRSWKVLNHSRTIACLQMAMCNVTVQ